MKRTSQSEMIAHLTVKCHHSLLAASYGPHKTPESGKSSMS